MSVKYALVSVRDGKRKVKYIILTKDIKGFNPQNAEDIPNQEYMVRWQESFYGEENQLEHDGHYPGEILLAGATKQEIIAKAKERKIKLPPNILTDQEVKAKTPPVPMGKPLRKSRNKPGHEDSDVKVKKRRMHEILEEVLPKPFDVKPIVASAELVSNDSAECSNTDSSPDVPLCFESLTKVVEPPSLFSKSGSRKFDEPDHQLTNEHEKLPSISMNASRKSPDVSDQQLTTLASTSKSGSQKLHDEPDNPSRVICNDNFLLLGDNNLSDFDDDDSVNDPDDLTVILAALKKKHAVCEVEVENLRNKSIKASNDLKAYRVELEKKRDTISKLKEEVRYLKSMNFSLQKQLLKAGRTGKTPCKGGTSPMSSLSFSTSSSVLVTSSPCTPAILSSKGQKSSLIKTLFGEDENNSVALQSESDLDSTLLVTPEVSHTIDSEGPPRRNLFMSPEKSSKRKNDNSDSSDLETIIDRVKEDLSGGKPLQEKGDKVYIGCGICINSKLWKQSTRKRRKDSMFYKDCAAGVWGVNELSKRFALRKVNGKSPCTPRKVDVINAMLLGKLMARGMGKREAQEVVDKQTKRWLAEKCYDCGRDPSQPKEKPEDA